MGVSVKQHTQTEKKERERDSVNMERNFVCIRQLVYPSPHPIHLSVSLFNVSTPRSAPSPPVSFSFGFSAFPLINTAEESFRIQGRSR